MAAVNARSLKCETEVSSDEASPTKAKGLKRPWYRMSFNRSWLTHPDFGQWIVENPDDQLTCSCRFCKVDFKTPNKSALERHSKTVYHRANVKNGGPIRSPKMTKKLKRGIPQAFLDRPELREWLCQIPREPFRGWCQYCATRLAPNLKTLLQHAKTKKHIDNGSNTPKPPPDEAVVVDDPAGFDMSASGGEDFGADDSFEPPQVQESGPKPKRLRSGRGVSPPVECDFSRRVTDAIGIGNRKVGFIGAGQIAQALAQGMLEQNLLVPSDILVSAPSQCHMTPWRRWKCRVSLSNDEVIREADIIFLAVKSSVVASMISKLSPVADGKTRLVISVVPGVTRDRLIELLKHVQPPTSTEHPEDEEGAEAAAPDDTGLQVVRAAPNKMCAIAAGFCAYCAGDDLPHGLYLVVETMFSALGRCVKVEEDRMNVYSTIVTSCAAFTCQFIEAMIQGGVNQSLSWEDSFIAVANVVSGTSQLLIRSGLEPSALRKAIATPGGSTLAALGEFQRGGLDHYVMSAMDLGCSRMAEAGSKI